MPTAAELVSKWYSPLRYSSNWVELANRGKQPPYVLLPPPSPAAWEGQGPGSVWSWRLWMRALTVRRSCAVRAPCARTHKRRLTLCLCLLQQHSTPTSLHRCNRQALLRRCASTHIPAGRSCGVRLGPALAPPAHSPPPRRLLCCWSPVQRRLLMPRRSSWPRWLLQSWPRWLLQSCLRWLLQSWPRPRSPSWSCWSRLPRPPPQPRPAGHEEIVNGRCDSRGLATLTATGDKILYNGRGRQPGPHRQAILKQGAIIHKLDPLRAIDLHCDRSRQSTCVQHSVR
jgi:hypothetical protein